jgi:hypothetical protein
MISVTTIHDVSDTVTQTLVGYNVWNFRKLMKLQGYKLISQSDQSKTEQFIQLIINTSNLTKAKASNTVTVL